MSTFLVKTETGEVEVSLPHVKSKKDAWSQIAATFQMTGETVIEITDTETNSVIDES